METTEYDLYDLLIGDDDISEIGDGSVTGALTSLDNSITNLVQVYFVSLNFGTVANGSTSTKTASVTAKPSDYTEIIVPKTTGWGYVSSSSMSGTTLSVTMGNNSGSSHTLSCGVYIIYYPISWKKY